MDIGQRIRSLRKARGQTLEELARATDLSQPFISQIERDIKSPSIETLTKICIALGVSLAEFFSSGEHHPHDVERLVAAARPLTQRQRDLLLNFLEQLNPIAEMPQGHSDGTT